MPGKNITHNYGTQKQPPKKTQKEQKMTKQMRTQKKSAKKN
jgi:hypothetical protein